MEKLKISDVLNQLRFEFEERLRAGGFTWNKDGILHTFDRAVGTVAFWYADKQMENRDGKIGGE